MPVTMVTLRELVDELLGQTAALGVTVTKRIMQTAVERAKRSNADKRALLGNLDVVLEREIKAGLFEKTGPDTFTLPPKNKKSSKSQPVNTARSHRELKDARGQVVPHRPMLPAPIFSQLMHSSQRGANPVALERSMESSVSVGAMSVPPLRLRRTLQVVTSASASSSYVREEWSLQQQSAPMQVSGQHFQELRREMRDAGSRGFAEANKSRKIFDPADHDSPARKRKAGASPTPPSSSCLGSATLTATKTCTVSATLTAMSGAPTATIEDITGVDSASLSQAPDVVSLERPTSSVVRVNDQLEIVRQRAPDFFEEFGAPGPAAAAPIPRPNPCQICEREAGGQNQDLLECKSCSACVHPSCLHDSFGFAKNITASTWQCNNCKTCDVCQEAYDKESLVLCNSCDLGFHLDCLRPPLTSKPNDWKCSKCDPAPPKGVPASDPKAHGDMNETTESEENNDTSVENNKAAESEETNETPDENNATAEDFLPAIPPQLHPAKGLLPPNWEDYPPDPQIPDVTGWNVRQVADYFRQNGFNREQVESFLEKEIDGKSLLLLHRDDVIGALGLKLGPALRAFSHITRLQTRRKFPVF